MTLNEDIEKARQIKAFLEKNYRYHYSYDALEQKFYITKLHLQIAFKIIANDTVHDFVTKVRVENSKILLENTNRTIRDIAKSVGLDKSNFIKQFKKHTGKTPTKWRQNPRSGDELPLENTGT